MCIFSKTRRLGEKRRCISIFDIHALNFQNRKFVIFSRLSVQGTVFCLSSLFSL
jgi:hypothetical protein